MRPLIALGVYLIVVFVGAALLAPSVYHGMQLAAAHFPFGQRLAHQPFHRYVTRCMLIIALGGIWPLVRFLRLSSLAQIGFAKSDHRRRNLLKGLALGFTSLAVAAALPLAFGARHLQSGHSGSEILRHLANAGGAAVAVGCLEELLFRGIIFGALRESLNWKGAAIISSALYAIVHFFQRATASEPIAWNSGFVVLNRMLAGFADGWQLWPGFVNLFLAGLILAFVYEKTGSLYYSIGLHGGWIFWLKSYGFLTTESDGASVSFWGSSKLIDGWMALLVLGAVFAMLQRRQFHGDKLKNA